MNPYRYVLALAMCLLLVPLTEAEDAIGAARIAVPDSGLLGKPLGSAKAFNVKASETIFPESIHFDLDGQVVYGLMATYPESVKLEQLIEAINQTQKKWWRDADRKMAKFGVSVWRNEESRVAYQASGSQIIMIWIDRRVTKRETKGVSEAKRTSLTRDVAKAAEEVENEKKKQSPNK